MINTLRLIRNWWARWKLSDMPDIRISSKSRVQHRLIRFRTGCSLEVGEESIVEAEIQFERSGVHIKIGERTYIGSSRIISAERVEIGNDVLVSWGCTVVDHNSHPLDWQSRSQDVSQWIRGNKDWRSVKMSPIKIEDRAWVGFNVIILKGVIIGRGAIVGAGSVVTRDVPPYTIVAGNPAQIIREIPLEER